MVQILGQIKCANVSWHTSWTELYPTASGVYRNYARNSTKIEDQAGNQ